MIALRTLFITVCAVFACAQVYARDYTIFTEDRLLNDGSRWTHPAWVCQLDPSGVRTAMVQWRMGEEGTVSLTIPGHGLVRVNVQRFTVLEPGAQVVTQNGVTVTPIAPPEALQLRGSVQGMPGSHVMLSVFNGWALGYITIGDERFIMSALSKNTPTSMVVCLERFLARTDPWVCHVADTDDGVVVPEHKAKNTDNVQALDRVVRLAVDCDFDFYTDLNSNVYRAAEYAMAVWGSVSDIYQREVNSAISLTWLGFWTVTDPFPGTTVDALIQQTKTYWDLNRTGINRSAVHLMSGVNGIGGMGNIDVLCTNNGYAVSGTNNTYTYPITGYLWDTDVTSHELGHNVGSRHTHSCTWNPPIDSCVAAESGNCYTGTKPRQGTIMSYCHLTAFGTQLVMHPRVSQYMAQRIAQRSCLALPATADLNISAGVPTTMCNGTSIKLEGVAIGGVAPLQFAWLPNVDITGINTLTPTVSPKQTITYVLEVRDANGAVKYDSVLITVGPRLVVSTPDTIRSCSGQSLVLEATSVDAADALQYTWRWPYDTVSSASNKLTLTRPQADSFMVYCIASDGRKACESIDSTFVVFNSSPRVTLTGPNAVCPNVIPRIQSSITGGTPPFLRTWRVNGSVFPGQADGIDVPATDDANVRLVVVDAKGCIDTADFVFVVRKLAGQVLPANVAIPPIGACDSVSTVTVMIKNTGTVAYTIDSIYGGTVVSDLWPIPLAPNASATVEVLLENLPVGAITRLIEFVDDQCRQRFTATATGRRGPITVTSKMPVIMPNIASCDVTPTRIVEIGVLNNASATVTFDSIETINNPGLFMLAKPTSFAASRIGIIELTLSRAVPEGTLEDDVIMHYVSGGCRSSLNATVKLTSVPFTMSTTTEIEFPDNHEPVIQEQPVSITVQSTGLTTVRLDSVRLKSPFTTTLKKGDIIDVGRTLERLVRFDPTKARTNVTRDTLVLLFGGCQEETRIPLTALVSVVGVDESVATTRISISNGTLTVVATDAQAALAVEVADLEGRAIVSTSGTGIASCSLPGLADGVYAITARMQGTTTRTLVMVSNGSGTATGR